tara:strand:+ start:1514 stop:3307 length:1794 start_codon:yes stop_codon:yes gene_type:complete
MRKHPRALQRKGNNSMQTNIYHNTIVKKMQTECPEVKKTTGRPSKTYDEIVRAWFNAMGDAVQLLKFYDRDTGLTHLEVKSIEKLFNYQYKKNGTRLRWYKWFRNNCPLWTEIKKGYSIPGGKAMATQIETTQNEIEYYSTKQRGGLYNEYVTTYINTTFAKLSDDEIGEYDVVYQKYDVKSLDRFIQNSINTLSNSTLNDSYRKTIAANLAAAHKIVSITATAHDKLEESLSGKLTAKAYFPVISHQSSFGRIYHLGTNLQNCHNELKTAALGNTTCIDIQASVFGFYHWMCTEWLETPAPTALTYMITDRKAFRAELAAEVFANSTLSTEKQISIIKQALTATGFGARIASLKLEGRKLDKDGNPEAIIAIEEIITNPAARKRFVEHKYVIQIAQLIRMLTNAVREMYTTDVEFKEMIQNNQKMYNPGQKRLNYKQILSYLYQQYEARLRDLMTDCVEQDHNGVVILQTHDGIYVEGITERSDLTTNLHYTLKSINSIVKFEITHPEGYGATPSTTAKTEQQDHIKSIRAEEKAAKEKMIPAPKPITTTPKHTLQIEMDTALDNDATDNDLHAMVQQIQNNGYNVEVHGERFVVV